jgi:hypothetical protein
MAAKPASSARRAEQVKMKHLLQHDFVRRYPRGGRSFADLAPAWSRKSRGASVIRSKVGLAPDLR